MATSSFKIRVPHEAAELIRGMHPNLKKKIRASLNMILSNPDKGKALKEELVGLRSFPIGNFRIIYRTSKHQVEVVAIGPRQRIYEETFLTLKREGSKY